MAETKVLTTLEEIRTFSDPYRLEIISTMHQLRKPATVKQVAVKMGEVPAKVYYHMKKMEKVGLVRIAYTQEINGIIAKFYEPTAEIYRIAKEEVQPKWIDAILTEERQAYGALFDKNKNLFIKYAPDHHKNLHLASKILYLTDEEAATLKQEIRQHLEQYQKPASPNRKPYAYFSSLVGVGEDKIED